MMTILWASALATAIVAQPLHFSDDAEGLNLLQIAAAKHNNTDLTHPTGGNYDCELQGDVHVVRKFDGESGRNRMEIGLYEYAKSADGRFNAQLYQCAAWYSPGIGWLNALAYDVDGTRIVILPPIHSERETNMPFYIRANDIEYSSADAPFTIPGTNIEIRRHKHVYDIVIKADGFSSAVTMYTSGESGNQPGGYAWIDTGISFGAGNNPPADANSFCANTEIATSGRHRVITPIADSSLDADWSQSLFSAADHVRICDYCIAYNQQSDHPYWKKEGSLKCAQPPPQPPPPPAKTECEEHGCSWVHAQELCSSLTGNDDLYNDCLFDFCITCVDFAAVAFIESEANFNPSPTCVQGATECLPDEVCSEAVKMNTLTVTQNNLGGVGPDEGAEEIRYSNAAVVNGRTLDLVLTTDGTFQTSKPTKNGNSGPFGVLNVKCGSSVTVKMQVVDSESGAPVTLDAVAVTWYDLDEGKKEKGRATVTTCGSTGAIVSDNTELVVVRTGSCSTATSSTPGTGHDNPQSPHQLDSLQISRALTLPFKGVSEWVSTLSLEKGFKGRNFMFAIEPSVACGTE